MGRLVTMRGSRGKLPGSRVQRVVVGAQSLARANFRGVMLPLAAMNATRSGVAAVGIGRSLSGV